ncbi:hypothetical protein TWF718_011113 [Orbilia javanica]|uniref:F-box domain-containing protein n=1 Tax=Orbilia javanica TaxID=47235 RepID=A0AAN8MKY9_9PEZI
MASLASFPQELVDMIFAHLTPANIGKVRLLSQDHNARFKPLFWYLVFQPLTIDLRPNKIARLGELVGDCEIVSQIHNVTVRQMWGEDLGASRITPLLTRAFAGLPDIRNIKFEASVGTGGFDYWKPVIDAIIKNKKKTVESISGPRCGIQLSKFKFSVPQLRGYQTTFENLKKLDITVSVQCERADLTVQFWLFIEKIGNKIEDLTVRTSRTARTAPRPNSHGRYLPPNLSLPKLKALKLVDTAVTPLDLTVLLWNLDMVSIDISQCRMVDPMSQWFEVMKYLRNSNFVNLKHIRLMLSSRYGDDSYDLPNLLIDVDGNWTDEGNNCQVVLNSGVSKHYITSKNLWSELGAYDEFYSFWDSLTNLKWTTPRVTRWKRLLSAADQRKFQIEDLGGGWSDEAVAEIDDEYEQLVNDINAEVDSDCEEVQ